MGWTPPSIAMPRAATHHGRCGDAGRERVRQEFDGVRAVVHTEKDGRLAVDELPGLPACHVLLAGAVQLLAIEDMRARRVRLPYPPSGKVLAAIYLAIYRIEGDVTAAA